MIAGLSGGSGKSLCSAGLISELISRGYRVAPFKKGPDFIDSAWLSRAGSFPCRNLDVFLMGPAGTKRSFSEHVPEEADICIIEGNRGLFDGIDKKGSYSTANLAELLNIKVLLVVDCTKMTGTVAALVLGCKILNPRVSIAGVILNRTGGSRHVKVLKEAVEYHTKIPVVGAIPKLKNLAMFERHLGLMPPSEHRKVGRVIDQARQAVNQYLDIDRIVTIARRGPNPERAVQSRRRVSRPSGGKKTIGIIRDRAFNFYYPENLEDLEKNDVAIIELDAFRDRKLPEFDLLYIGGGFPETCASGLVRNRSFKNALKEAVEKGLPVYAECGGVVYLGSKLQYKNRTYAMTGVFPLDFEFSPKPKGHGYTVLKITGKNPFFKIGTVLKGHEFHYTGPANLKNVRFAAEVKRGFGFDGRRDGLVYKNVFATYTHLHAMGVRNWARYLLPSGRPVKNES
jgi:cobyrinic acid a,c-diamide synthase